MLYIYFFPGLYLISILTVLRKSHGNILVLIHQIILTSDWMRTIGKITASSWQVTALKNRRDEKQTCALLVLILEQTFFCAGSTSFGGYDAK